MSNPARVESIDALKMFRRSIIKFIEAANVALGDAESEMQRRLNWLENEQDSYWQGQIRKRTEDVAKAKDAVRQKELFKDFAGRTPSADQEKKALRIAIARLEEAERERRFLTEQLAQVRADFTKAANALREHGWSMETPRKAVALPDLKGYIQDVKTDQGRTFATISLGSKEHVEKGMEFSVVDQTEGTVLGKFIVDTVDPDTSFGRLEGPRVQNVRRENLVLSRL